MSAEYVIVEIATPFANYTCEKIFGHVEISPRMRKCAAHSLTKFWCGTHPYLIGT